MSTTAIVLSEGDERLIIRAGAAIRATISSGARIVVIMKLFFATRSLNSRDMIMLKLDFMSLFFYIGDRNLSGYAVIGGLNGPYEYLVH